MEAPRPSFCGRGRTSRNGSASSRGPAVPVPVVGRVDPTAAAVVEDEAVGVEALEEDALAGPDAAPSPLQAPDAASAMKAQQRTTAITRRAPFRALMQRELNRGRWETQERTTKLL